MRKEKDIVSNVKCLTRETQVKPWNILILYSTIELSSTINPIVKFTSVDGGVGRQADDLPVVFVFYFMLINTKLLE